MWWRIVLAGVAAGSCAIVLTAGARGGSAPRPAATTVATPPSSPAARRPALDSADVRFARSLAADLRDDAAVDTLASRKAATSHLMLLTTVRRAEDKRDLAAVARAAPRSESVDRAQLPGALVANAGWRFDVVYLALAVQRDRLEQALARRELRWGRSAGLKALARRIVRVRTAETDAFGSSS